MLFIFLADGNSGLRKSKQTTFYQWMGFPKTGSDPKSKWQPQGFLSWERYHLGGQSHMEIIFTLFFFPWCRHGKTVHRHLANQAWWSQQKFLTPRFLTGSFGPSVFEFKVIIYLYIYIDRYIYIYICIYIYIYILHRQRVFSKVRVEKSVRWEFYQPGVCDLRVNHIFSDDLK